MTSQPAHQRALDDLETSLNSIFLQIGATFDAPANFEPGNLPRTRAQLQQSVPKQHYSFQRALDRLEHELNHARSVLCRDMNAMSSNRSKQENRGSSQNGHVDPSVSNELKEESAMVTGMAETAIGPNTNVSTQPSDTDMTMDVPKLDVQGEKGVQEQTQDAEGSGAPIFNDEDLFGFDASPLPTPQTADLNMEDADGGVPLPSTEIARSASQAPETVTVNGTTDDIDDLFGDNGIGGDAVDMNSTEQQDTEVSSLLPGLEFYANESNATPGGLDVLGDMTGTGAGSLDLPELNGVDDGSGFMIDDGGDGQTAMMGGSTFDDDWLTGLGGGNTQNGEGQTNGDDAQFDASFFNLD